MFGIPDSVGGPNVKKQISIVVVDDHAMVREMLQTRLQAESDMRVVACVADANEGIEQVIIHLPDVILMDIDMPGILCFDAAKTIGLRSPETRIIFLSAFFHDRYIQQALAVGAWGYITKGQSEESLVAAIRKVASGVTFFSPEVQSRMVVDSSGTRLASAVRTRMGTLTEREVQVLRYIARGLPKKEIAQIMHISMNTVNRHTTNLMMKLDIHDRVELARLAIREGVSEA